MLWPDPQKLGTFLALHYSRSSEEKYCQEVILRLQPPSGGKCPWGHWDNKKNLIRMEFRVLKKKKDEKEEEVWLSKNS